MKREIADTRIGRKIAARRGKSQRADRRRRRVVNFHIVLVAHLPMPARVRVVGHTFEHQSRCSVRKRSVDDVAGACNPSDMRRAPVNIAGVIVENVLMGHGGVNEITARRM